MQKVESFFKDKTVGFYVGFGLSAGAALLSLIVGIVYGACYSHSVYLNGWGVALPIVGAVIFAASVAVSIAFDEKLPYVNAVGTVGLWLFDFIGFVVFINASYLYLSEVFFAGVSLEAFGNMEGSYIVCVLFNLLAVVLSNVGMFMYGGKGVKPAKTTASEEVQS